jgi:glutathionyl-hydroquinone reductase
MASPKIILYTNRGCPWAHRAHIALKELGLQYEEVTIDLSVPREPWYLEVNPVCTYTLATHQYLAGVPPRDIAFPALNGIHLRTKP